MFQEQNSDSRNNKNTYKGVTMFEIGIHCPESDDNAFFCKYNHDFVLFFFEPSPCLPGLIIFLLLCCVLSQAWTPCIIPEIRSLLYVHSSTII